MLNTFRKLFIPHEENRYRPHILREGALLLMVLMVVLVEMYFIATFTVVPNYVAAVLPGVVVEETNTHRIEEAAPPLAVHISLQASAQAKADDMATRGYFAHDTPEGLRPWYWIKQAGYDYAYAGENLAVNFFDSKDVADAWMRSPTHRANILNPKFTDVGVALARGTFRGKEAVFVVQHFGTPRTIDETIERNDELGASAFSALSQHPVADAASVRTAPSPLPFWKYLIASPRVLTDIMLGVIFALITFALLLKIFVRIKIQYPTLIGNSIFVLAIICSLVLLNGYIAFAHALVF